MMRRKSTLLFALAVSFIICGCRKPEGPIPVAEKFLSAMQNHDYEEAGVYGTEETNKLLRQFEKIEKLNGTLPDRKPQKIIILSEDTRGKSATVYFKEEGDSLEQKISLVKVRGDDGYVWKVALKKEEIRMMQEKDKAIKDLPS